MERDKRESLCPGSSSQKCRRTEEPPKYSVMKTPASLEHKLRKIAVGPDSGLKEPPSSEPPGSPWPVVPPTFPDLEQLQKLPLTSTDKQYPLMKQRGFYSDILSPGSLDKLGEVCCGPPMNQNLLRQADLDKFTPKVRTFEFPDDFEERLKEERIGATTQLLTQADFPLQAYEPKVQVPFLVLPGQCPRKIEIERYGWWAVGGPVPTTWGGGQRAIQ
ncbi:Dynein heavy chain 1, axonemal [Myotis brandtii]|uniref:Dynein heavy chain 1, axonemal n=1 Tax=Myotis brandtii TaxID=109478 RepID=S7MP53_MYOBR|nr:Dynein heavy chain 1, axonemal [Myotis brandtii]